MPERTLPLSNTGHVGDKSGFASNGSPLLRGEQKKIGSPNLPPGVTFEPLGSVYGPFG